MKNLIINMIKNKHSSVKAEAQQNKKLEAKNKSKIKNETIEEVLEEKTVMKEPKTLMLD